ncbi:MAG: hypothetical protein BGN99_21970 [Alphaproteobacteria bacterium 65-37]|nr:MAG: hypothetical protein BGN99_21970 [Alphaproteobacteria bacterium 65-37]
MPGQPRTSGETGGRAGRRTRQGEIRPRHRGLIAAYLLVAAAIAGSAALVFGDIRMPAPQVVDSAAAAVPLPPAALSTPPATSAASAAAPTIPAEPAVVQSLALPARPVPTGFRDLSPAQRAAMVETTSDGLRLPRIAPDGWMPWIANARRFDPAGPPARIGLLMINLGANEAAMMRAIEELPAEVSLAFLAATPDLPRWLARARALGHESYLMLPTDDPMAAERGIRPIEANADAAENLRRLRLSLARGTGYVGLVLPSTGPVTQSEAVLRPLVKEIAEHGLALVEINPSRDSAPVQRLTAEFGAGYARSADVLDYKLAGESVLANLDRLTAWVAEAPAGETPRHAFGVMQPDDETIDAIVAWSRRRPERPAMSFVPLIGHFECREACMVRLRTQPAQLRP